MSKKLHRVVVIGIGLSTFLFFQNCSEGFQVRKIDPLSSLAFESGLGSVTPVPSMDPPGLTRINGRLAYICDVSKVPKTSAVKLSKREYREALFGLVKAFNFDIKPAGDAEVEAAISLIPGDSFNSGHFTVKEDNFVQSSRAVNTYFDAAFVAGALVANSYNLGQLNDIVPGTAACLKAGQKISSACHQILVKELGSVAFRRNLDDTAVTTLANSLYDSTLSREELIQLTFTSIAQMPDFVFRAYDQGTTSPRGSRVISLNAYDLASKVSFFLVGKAPDATLKSLAANGQILNNAVLGQQVDRLLATNESKENIKRLFRESYGYDRFDAFNYSNEFLEGLDRNNLTQSMKDELDEFFTNIVITKKGPFSDLMTSQEASITSDQLAALYKSGKGAVLLDNSRAGFINRGSFLARRSGNYTSPVKRGLAIVENVLCDSIPDPPPSAPTTVSEDQIVSDLQSTRQRYTHLTEIKGSSCIACHSQMNNLGYTFENFDSIGRLRSTEKIFDNTGVIKGTVPLNTLSEIPNLRSSTTVIANSRDLATDLSTNDKAIMCFARHLTAFQARAPAAASDGCQMNESLKSLYGNNGTQGSIQSAIKSLILADDFKFWSY